MPCDRPRNILIIHTDQQRYDSLGCTGNPHAVTPNIDALARDGTVFTRHIVANTVCMPSRASLFTGLYPPAHGVWDNGVPLNRREYIEYSGVRDGEGIVVQPPTIADMCAEQGYRTACFGKMHLTPFFSPPVHGYHESQLWWQESPEELREWHGPYYGFQYADMAFTHGQLSQGHYRLWLQENHPEVYRRAVESDPARVIPELGDLHPADVPLELHPTTWLGRRFAEYLERTADDGRPFMAFVGFPDPHHPWQPTREALEVVEDRDVLDRMDPEGTGLPDYVFGSAGGSIAHFTDEQKRTIRRYTLAQLYQIDRVVGHICQALQDRGMWQNTLVVFTSDHGDFLGDHNYLRKGVGAAHSLLHVPCVLRVPWMDDQPERVDAPMSNCDVLPTVLAQAGVPVPERVHGKDVFDAASGAAPCAFAYCSRGTPETTNHTVYDPRYRYTVYPQADRDELFDHEGDPGECRNLVEEPPHAQRRRNMRDMVKEALLRHRSPVVGRIAPW